MGDGAPGRRAPVHRDGSGLCQPVRRHRSRRHGVPRRWGGGRDARCDRDPGPSSRPGPAERRGPGRAGGGSHARRDHTPPGCRQRRDTRDRGGAGGDSVRVGRREGLDCVSHTTCGPAAGGELPRSRRRRRRRVREGPAPPPGSRATGRRDRRSLAADSGPRSTALRARLRVVAPVSRRAGVGGQRHRPGAGVGTCSGVDRGTARGSDDDTGRACVHTRGRGRGSRRLVVRLARSSRLPDTTRDTDVGRRCRRRVGGVGVVRLATGRETRGDARDSPRGHTPGGGHGVVPA